MSRLFTLVDPFSKYYLQESPENFLKLSQK